jgi:glutathione synthase/RimK-type ligase-like ATP-grasp enzyme
MILTYSGRSAPSAHAIALQGGIQLNRGNVGDINWGRAQANTKLNPDISNVTNKRRMRELFKEHGVPMPRLASMSLNRFNNQMMPVTGDFWPLVGRPDVHSRGRGFWLCRNINDVHKALAGTRKKKAATHFMEFIDAPREYRVHIFKGKSIRISQKDFYEDGYVTIRPQHNVKHIRKAAKQAVEAVGLDFGAVDILADDDQCWVLEVNAAPGLGGSMPQLYADTFKRWDNGEFDD